MNKKAITLVATLIVALSATAQNTALPQMASPLKQDIALSATFAEFRANHFHGGLDMRVGGVIGVPVYAADDGYVSRISISPWGGGKVLYITHPSGYTSVYMHLNDYAGSIGTWVHDRQYTLRSYPLSEDLPEGLITVKRGQLIAHSGNTGGSAGPHLHFEIRHTATGQALNPLDFGLTYRDGIAPTIRGIRLYPSDNLSTLNGDHAPLLLKGDTVAVAGSCYIGLYATDAAEGSTQRNGIDHVEIDVDGQPFFRYTTRTFPIDSTRIVNALIDHPHFASTREPYLLTRGLPGIEGPWVSLRHNNGHLEFRIGSRHKVDIRVYDIKNNVASRTFYIRTVAQKPSPINSDKATGYPVAYDHPFAHTTSTLRINMEARTLYDNDLLAISTLDPEATLSPRYCVNPQRNIIPPHKGYTIAIHATPDINVTADKVVIARIDANRTTAYATQYSDGWYSATVRDFGTFALLPDTEAPTVQPVNFKPYATIKNTVLKIKVSDNLSGVDTYHCYINGTWVLAEYDGKSATLTLNAARFLRRGNNELQVDVRDGCGNLTRKKYALSY